MSFFLCSPGSKLCPPLEVVVVAVNMPHIEVSKNGKVDVIIEPIPLLIRSLLLSRFQRSTTALSMVVVVVVGSKLRPSPVTIVNIVAQRNVNKKDSAAFLTIDPIPLLTRDIFWISVASYLCSPFEGVFEQLLVFHAANSNKDVRSSSLIKEVDKCTVQLQNLLDAMLDGFCLESNEIMVLETAEL